MLNEVVGVGEAIRRLALLPVLVYAGPPDLRFERLPWNPEIRGCADDVLQVGDIAGPIMGRIVFL